MQSIKWITDFTTLLPLMKKMFALWLPGATGLANAPTPALSGTVGQDGVRMGQDGDRMGQNGVRMWQDGVRTGSGWDKLW